MTFLVLMTGACLVLAVAGGIEQAVEWYWRREEERGPLMQAHPVGRAYRLR